MLDILSSANIIQQATSWVSEFDNLLLVVVGMGMGFATVRFVKSLFF